MKKPNRWVAVDASCIGNPGPMEYKIVDIASKKVLFHSPVFPEWTNNLGEFLAVVTALHLCVNWKIKTDIIYSDSETALAWVKSKKIKTTLAYTEKTKELLAKVQDATVWLKTHQFSVKLVKWETEMWGEIPADFGRK